MDSNKMTNMTKIVDGDIVPLTQDDIDEFNQRVADYNAKASERIQEQFTLALNRVLNDKASEKNYSSELHCVSYLNSTNSQKAAEAKAFIAWRDSCNDYSYDYIQRAKSGQIPTPSFEDYSKGLPTLSWP